MPQIAVKGIYRNGEIIPLEDIPAKETMDVIIVFLDDAQSRYEQQDWQVAEKQASEDYRAGKIKSAADIEQMFEQIEGRSDGN